MFSLRLLLIVACFAILSPYTTVQGLPSRILRRSPTQEPPSLALKARQFKPRVQPDQVLQARRPRSSPRPCPDGSLPAGSTCTCTKPHTSLGNGGAGSCDCIAGRVLVQDTCVPESCTAASLTWHQIRAPGSVAYTPHLDASTSATCCSACSDTPNCVYWYLTSGSNGTDKTCRVGRQRTTSEGECPLGTTSIGYTPGAGSWGIGPCGSSHLDV